jgi:hypothetical protein
MSGDKALEDVRNVVEGRRSGWNRDNKPIR